MTSGFVVCWAGDHQAFRDCCGRPLQHAAASHPANRQMHVAYGTAYQVAAEVLASSFDHSCTWSGPLSAGSSFSCHSTARATHISCTA